jgi:CRISPR/Cas system CSM-associated protein Csm3 (group 7 of RAMP superfamily)
MSSHHQVTATLRTLGPLRIGRGTPDERSDLPVQRDLRGRPCVPGSSLAGALRAAAARRYPDRVEHLFGADQPYETGQRHERHVLEPSRVQVQAATVLSIPGRAAADSTPAEGDGLASLSTQVRPRVGIDRERLSAKPNVLFDAESWPSGLRLGIDLSCPTEDLEDVVGVLEALTAPDGGLGAGPCPVALDDWVVAPVEQSAVRMLEAALARGRGEPPPTGGEPPMVPAPTARAAEARRIGGWMRLDLTVRLTEPLACRLPLDPSLTGGQARDSDEKDPDNLPFPLAVIDSEHGMAWTVGLPASSLKGVLRQRAERACAYLAGARLAEPWSIHRETPVTRLFGWSSDDRQQAGAAGRLRCSDLRHGHLVPEGQTSGGAGDGKALRGPEAVLNHPAYASRPRVRIDRLTGSVLGSALFTDAFVRDGEQLDGTLTLVDAAARPDRRVPVDPRDFALLAVGLRDLTENVAGVGGSTRSGYGAVRLTELTVSWGRAGEPPPAADAADDGPPRHETIEVAADGGISWPEWMAEELRAGWQTVTAELAPDDGGRDEKEPG